MSTSIETKTAEDLLFSHYLRTGERLTGEAAQAFLETKACTDERDREQKSAESVLFAHYLRTGERLYGKAAERFLELKFNQRHYRENGQFARAGEGVSYGGGGAAIRPAARARHSKAPAGNSRTALSNGTSAGTSQPKRDIVVIGDRDKQFRDELDATFGVPINPNRNAHTTRKQPSAAPTNRPLQREGYTPWTQVGTHPARAYRTKSGAAIIDPRSGNPMLVPQGVSIANTIRSARMYSSWLNRDLAAETAFERGGPLDFQRTHSTLRDGHGKVMIDQRFIAIGNYNFGVYAAASGMSLKRAMGGAAGLFFTSTGRTGGNRKNESLIISGYNDFKNGNVGE